MAPTRTIIITGGNSGLGRETARLLAAHEENFVVIASRSAGSGQETADALTAQVGHARWLHLDLESQASVRSFVEAFRQAAFPPLHALICNAGYQNVGVPAKNEDGYETTFAINHLGHYLLSRLLLPDLTAGGRITIVASGVHDPAVKSGMPHPAYTIAEAVAQDFKPGRTEGLRRYSTSKLCNVLYAYELSRRLSEADDSRLASIKVNAIDPGLMPATGLARSFPPHLRWVSRNILPLLRFVMDNVHLPEVSAERVVAITTGAQADASGKYFSNGKAVRSSVDSYNQTKWRDLWETSARMTDLTSEL